MHDLFAFGEDEFDVAGVGHVGVYLESLDQFDALCDVCGICWVEGEGEEGIGKREVVREVRGREGKTYASMSTIGTTTLLRRLIDLDVFDDQVSGIETFGVGV